MARKISLERIGEMMQAVLSELKARGGEARLRDLFVAVESKLKPNEYESGTYEKSGYIRWQAIIHFYSIDCVKAGYIRKSGGKWYLTDVGEQALMVIVPLLISLPRVRQL